MPGSAKALTLTSSRTTCSPKLLGGDERLWQTGDHYTLVGKGIGMSDDCARGQRDGLRLALAVLAAEEAKWAALLGESRSWRTNATRDVRHKTLQVAQKRVQTVLGRLMPKEDSMSAELASALDRLGL